MHENILPYSISRTLYGADETSVFAISLARYLHSGDILLLSGPVGAGKSHFARSLVTTLLTSPEDIPSPTYTLVQTYESSAGEIWHADLYRLEDSAEIGELGLLEAFDQAICLIEWPERLENFAPAHALNLGFFIPESYDRRELTLTWSAPRWSQILPEALDDINARGADRDLP